MEFEQDRKLNVAKLLSKVKTLQFEISAKKSKCSVEDGIGDGWIEGNTLKAKINQKDLGAGISHIKSLEILNTYGSSCVSKHCFLQDGVIHVELEVCDNLEDFQGEVSLEVRIVYKNK